MDILCCPGCGGALRLRAECMRGSDILEGSVLCGNCRVAYPITGGILDILSGERSEK